MFIDSVELYKYDAHPVTYYATIGIVPLTAVQVKELLLNTKPVLH